MSAGGHMHAILRQRHMAELFCGIDDIYTFRNQSFKSVVTGVESTVNKTLFMDNFDDTMEGILSQFKWGWDEKINFKIELDKV